MDIKKLKERFLQLPIEQQRHELHAIFSGLQQKNNHCKYIYLQLHDHPERFDQETIRLVFTDLLSVYERINHDFGEQKKVLLEKSAHYLQHIHELEQREREQDKQATEDMLLFE